MPKIEVEHITFETRAITDGDTSKPARFRTHFATPRDKLPGKPSQQPAQTRITTAWLKNNN